MEHAPAVEGAYPETTPIGVSYGALLDRLVRSDELNSHSIQLPFEENLPALVSMEQEDRMEPDTQDRDETASHGNGNTQEVRSLDTILENLMRATEPTVDDLLMRLIQNAPPSPRNESRDQGAQKDRLDKAY